MGFLMEVEKRDGRKVLFDKNKIIIAVQKAFIATDGILTEYAITKSNNIADFVESKALEKNLTVEEIQDLVENGLMSTKRKDVAKAYILYRDERTRKRGNITDKEIQEILNGKSEYWNRENSNKCAKIVTTQRDYIAGVTSTDLTARFLLPKHIVDAHNLSIIHFHDADYFAQLALTNCELVNLDDQLTNGTVINNVFIDPPHKFTTASTIATQIILAVTSSTYGGCTVSLSHLAKFVRMARDKFYQKYINYGLSEEDANNLADIDLKKEVNDGVQTFNYQVNSMTNTNGQAPFLSVFMYLGETDEYKDELALIIEEFLNQRILGFKNKDGVYVTPAFPKLLYVLEEDNMYPDSKYYYLTELAAKCTAKRMVPDYISEKIMLQEKKDVNGEGHCYPCMGRCKL